MLTKQKHYITLLVTTCCLLLASQLWARPYVALADSTAISQPQRDSLTTDSVATDSIKKGDGLDAPITYEAADSVVFWGNNTAILYGSGVVNFKDIQLDADEIKMNMDSSIVYAQGRPDSVGTIIGLPKFQDASGQYDSKTLKYSFKSQKGYITDIVTQQGEGFLTGGQTKKTEGSALFLQDGRYTTCDDHDCPHFYLQLTKAKVVPGKNIVAGPAYMVLLGVPLPIAVPFGFFPFTDEYSSGIIMPTYGDEMERGFYLRDGGYYFALSDYFDLSLTGEIYSKGSWGLSAQTNYSKRYKYSGGLSLSYLTTITGDKGLPDYAKQTNFRVIWNHTQDTKANPNMTFSSSVNYSTSGYDRNNLDSYYNPNQFTENTKSSTVNLSYRFPDSPFSLSSSANITQRTQDSTLAVSLPEFTLSMSRIYPFKRKEMVGDERWYEKISMNYTGTFRNSITTKQDLILQSNIIKDWKNGMQHQVPMSATFSLFDHINVSPSFSFTDRTYFNKVMQGYDQESNRVIPTDTLYGFYNVYNFNTSVSAQTTLYGFYKPLPILGLEKIEAIRHVFSPNVSFTYAPDFSDPMWGAWNDLRYIDKNTGEEVIQSYSPFQNGMFGTAPRGKSGIVSFSMTNNLEMKLRPSENDTTAESRKVSLIENLTAGISYNMAADSMKWSNLNTSILLKLSKSFNLQLNAVFDTYTYQLSPTGSPVRVNIPRWEAGKGLGRLMSTGSSFSYTLNNSSFQKLATLFAPKSNSEGEPTATDGDEDSNPTPTSEPSTPTMNNNHAGEGEDASLDANGYQKWTIPWSLNFNYSISYGYGEFDPKKLEYKSKITQNLSFSGNIQPTSKWSLTFSSSYDFEAKKMAYMNCGVTRDLHCWTMGASFIPVGPYKSYNFHIAVNSSLLSDLKYDKQSSPYDTLDWY